MYEDKNLVSYLEYVPMKLKITLSNGSMNILFGWNKEIKNLHDIASSHLITTFSML